MLVHQNHDWVVRIVHEERLESPHKNPRAQTKQICQRKKHQKAHFDGKQSQIKRKTTEGPFY
jgi:hypothetical protein